MGEKGIVSQVPPWAQAESEAVRRLWVDAWALLEEARDMARDVERGRSIFDLDARILANRIDAFLRQAAATEPVTEAQRPSCANCGATLLGEHPTRCPLCGAPQFKVAP